VANRYWRGGAGSWDATAGTKWSTTSGGAGGSAVPAAADDVYIDANAGGNVTVTAAAVCRSLNFADGTGGSYTGTFTHNAAIQISIGDGTAGVGNVALRLSAGMTWAGLNPTTSIIALSSTSVTQQTINTAGKTVTTLTVSSTATNSNYLLSGTLTMTGTLTHLAGTLNTGNFAITAAGFNYGNNVARTLTLGSSTITLSGTTNTFTGTAVTNLTITANTAAVTFTGVYAALSNVFVLFGINWQGMSIVVSPTSATSCSLNASGGTIANLTINMTASQAHQFRFTNNINISNSLTINGNSLINRSLVFGANLPTSVILGGSATFASNASNFFDFMDIDLSGGSSAAERNFSAKSGVGDWQGNTGFTPTTSVIQTRDSTGGQSWGVAARWTSRVPLPQDDVVLNASSGSVSATDIFVLGRNLTATNYTATLTLTSNANAYSIFGNVALGTGLVWGVSPNTFILNLRGRSAQTITSNGRAFFPASTNQTVSLFAPDGSYSLQDAFSAILPASSNFSLSNGTFNSNNHSMSIGRLQSNSGLARTLNFGNSTVSLAAVGVTSPIIMATAALTLDAGNATFTITTASASIRTIDLGGATIGTLNYTVAGSTGQLSITTTAFVSTLNFSDATNARILQITAGTTLVCSNFNVFGAAGRLITVRSSTTAVAILNKPINGSLFTPSQNFIAYQYIRMTQPLSLWLNTNSTVLGSQNIASSAPTYRHSQSNATTITSTSITGTLQTATTGGNLLVAYVQSVGSTGAITAPSGWTQAVQSSQTSVATIYFKVANGEETSVVYTQATSRQLIMEIVEYSGFTGTPALDVTSSHSSVAAVTTLSTTPATGPTNTAQPALALAMVGSTATLGALTGLTNSFGEDFVGQNTSTIVHMAVRELTTTAAVATTFTWVTSRGNTVTALGVFINGSSTSGNFFPFF